MDNELRKKEEKALEAISNYMKLRLYAWVNYKNHKNFNQAPVISERTQEFWNNCIHAFEVKVIKPFCGRDVKLYKDLLNLPRAVKT